MSSPQEDEADSDRTRREDWWGIIAQIVDHMISKGELHSLGDALVLVDQEDNSIHVFSAARSKPTPPDYINIAAYCYIREAKDWEEVVRSFSALRATDGLCAPFTTMPVDILARSVARLLVEKMDSSHSLD